jgi:bifunctional UDP-N-acetylglucosamine pyrophosphorylase/glucosamine-1-phosphate N-acetyltransferase
MKKNVTVVVLAGGAGKRFAPFTTDKSVFPIACEPIIVRNMMKLTEAGLTRFVVVTNPANDAIIRSFSLPNAQIETVVQNHAKGMGDALLSAKSLTTGQAILVVNAEDVVDATLYHDIGSAINKRSPFVVGSVAKQYFDGGYLRVSQSRLVGIVEKPGGGKEPSNLIKLVFDYFPLSDPLLERLSTIRSTRDDQYEQALDTYVKEYPVSILSYDGYWSPLKYPWHVLDVTRHFLHHDVAPARGKNVDIRNNVIIEGSVYMGNNVKIFENTKIVGPAYIGDNTIIGNNNIIRESIIGKNCVTGFNTDITRSYIGDDCWFHSNYIGDSVLEGNISMGAGVVCANFRLDEQEILSTGRTKLGAMIARDVRIGVNTSVMPGVKIGTNTLIGAGIIVDNDLPDGSFCIGKTTYETKKNTRNISADRGKYKAKL